MGYILYLFIYFIIIPLFIIKYEYSLVIADEKSYIHEILFYICALNISPYHDESIKGNFRS